MADPARHRVLKFGGSSVGSPAALGHALSIAVEAAKEGPLVVVVSALSGVTDQLQALARGTGRGLDSNRILGALRERHRAALAAVADGPARRDAEGTSSAVWAALTHDLAKIASGGERTACDAILAAGERLAVPIFAAGLRARGLHSEVVDGAELIRTDDEWGEANVDFAATRVLVESRLKTRPAHLVPVVTGFVGGTVDGLTTVLGRGGSDYTAGLLGAALSADRVEIWTDVDGILSADPHLVDDAHTLERLSYAEALSLAQSGAKVLHPKTIPPLAEGRIPVFVGNTQRRRGPGSWVGAEGAPSGGLAKAVASAAANGETTVSVLAGRGDVTQLRGLVLQVLAAADLAATEAEGGAGAAVRVVVPTELRARAVQAIHAALVRTGGGVCAIG
jgi:bifunctional aspartokinase / homoserine dehydrogenase 1